jgi:hypothetical protein
MQKQPKQNLISQTQDSKAMSHNKQKENPQNRKSQTSDQRFKVTIYKKPPIHFIESKQQSTEIYTITLTLSSNNQIKISVKNEI